MKTFQLTFIDKMNALGFILDGIKNLPSALQLRLKENYPLDLNDKVLSRIYNDKYQIIIPQDDNELTINPVEFFIYDANNDQFVKDSINSTQDSVHEGDFAILDSYCGDSVIPTLDKVQVYSKVNPNAEDWNSVATKYTELLKKYDDSKSIPLSDMKEFVSLYNEIPDLTLLEVMNEATEPQVTEPEVAPSAETVVEPSVNAEPEMTAASEPAVEPEVTSEVTPEVTEPAVAEAISEPAVEPTEPEVTPTEPELQPEEPKTEEVNLDEMYEKLDSFENKLDGILEELGLDGEDPKESLISYGKLMKTLSQVDMGGTLL